MKYIINISNNKDILACEKNGKCEDLISKKQAIEAIMSERSEMNYPSYYAEIIQKLPSVTSIKNKNFISIGKLKPGTTIEVGGIQMEILDTCYPYGNVSSGVFCLAKDGLFKKAFDEGDCDNWKKSSLREYLNGEFLEEIGGKIGKDALLPFERDLTSDDGLKDYCEEVCVDKVSLISCDEYRKYRKHISYKSGLWWTLTPWSCNSGYSSHVRYVSSDGSLNSNNVHFDNFGVAPAFLFDPNVKVELKNF